MSRDAWIALAFFALVAAAGIAASLKGDTAASAPDAGSVHLVDGGPT